MAEMARSGLLEWTQPRVFDRLFELREGETPVGTLVWEGVLSRLATADTCLGSWEIEEIGLVSRTVEVREAGLGRLVATFSARLMGDGTLEFADGRRLRWESLNFWATDWCFIDDAGMQPVLLEEGVADAGWRDMFKMQYTVTLERSAYSAQEQVMLAALGLYLIFQRRQTAGATTAATTAAVC
jgi:hypothetical protein